MQPESKYINEGLLAVLTTPPLLPLILLEMLKSLLLSTGAAVLATLATTADAFNVCIPGWFELL
jgi:hypothetical protein